MAYIEKRTGDRSSYVMPSTLRVPYGDVAVRIRNLSAEGVMVDGLAGLPIGEPVSLQIPNLGWVHATVAWSIESRCGLAFNAQIDPQIADAGPTHGRPQKLSA